MRIKALLGLVTFDFAGSFAELLDLRLFGHDGYIRSIHR
jgi:hypothetical protein